VDGRHCAGAVGRGIGDGLGMFGLRAEAEETICIQQDDKCFKVLGKRIVRI
jgi:hypothetical protein